MMMMMILTTNNDDDDDDDDVDDDGEGKASASNYERLTGYIQRLLETSKSKYLVLAVQQCHFVLQL